MWRPLTAEFTLRITASTLLPFITLWTEMSVEFLVVDQCGVAFLTSQSLYHPALDKFTIDGNVATTPPDDFQVPSLDSQDIFIVSLGDSLLSFHALSTLVIEDRCTASPSGTNSHLLLGLIRRIPSDVLHRSACSVALQPMQPQAQ
jgi:hypothetical protein